MNVEHCYQILGIAPTKDLSVIRAAYLRMAKKWHPDINKSPNAQTVFQDVQVAYSFLKDGIESGSLFNTVVVHRTQNEERAYKREQARQKYHQQKKEYYDRLARIHTEEYIAFLHTSRIKKFSLTYKITLGIIVFQILIALGVIILGFLTLGYASIFVLIGFFMVTILHIIYYSTYIKEFYFLITQKIPTIQIIQ